MRIIRTALNIVDHQQVSLPPPATILHVAPGRGGYPSIDMWSIDDETYKTPAAIHEVWIHGTGHPMYATADVTSYVGTCVMPEGLVWHVFCKRAS